MRTGKKNGKQEGGMEIGIEEWRPQRPEWRTGNVNGTQEKGYYEQERVMENRKG